MKLIYPACFYPDENEKDYYTVVIPDLPGAVTEGKTLAEAFEMAIDCASGWVLGELEDGNPVPEASSPSAISANEYPNGFVEMISFDIDAYAKKYGTKSFRSVVPNSAYIRPSC